MKVLYLVPPGLSPDHPASWGVHMRQVIEGLRRLGAVVRTLETTPFPVAALSQPGQAALPRSRLRAFPGDAARDARRLVASCALARRGLGLVREFRPDILYERAHHLWMTGWLLARWSRLPRVVEMNALYTDTLEHGWRYASPRLARCLQRRKTFDADRVIAVSAQMRDDLIRTLGLPPRRVAVVHNGTAAPAVVDTAAVATLRQRLGLAGSLVCGFVGYILPAHGVDGLIRAAARVTTPGGVKVLVVGAGHNLRDLADVARKVGLSDRVVLVGAVPQEEIPIHLACMDICAIPRHGDRNCPLKLFEYGMAGKAIVSSTAAGILEVWTPGEHGIGIRDGSEDDLARAIERYAADPALRERHGRAFQRKVMAEHTWTRVAERTLAILTEVVSLHRPAALRTAGI